MRQMESFIANSGVGASPKSAVNLGILRQRCVLQEMIDDRYHQGRAGRCDDHLLRSLAIAFSAEDTNDSNI